MIPPGLECYSDKARAIAIFSFAIHAIYNILKKQQMVARKTSISLSMINQKTQNKLSHREFPSNDKAFHHFQAFKLQPSNAFSDSFLFPDGCRREFTIFRRSSVHFKLRQPTLPHSFRSWQILSISR